MNHDDCTCCRHWRRFEQRSQMDPAPERQRTSEIVGEGPEDEPPIALLPPRPSGAELA